MSKDRNRRKSTKPHKDNSPRGMLDRSKGQKGTKPDKDRRRRRTDYADGGSFTPVGVRVGDQWVQAVPGARPYDDEAQPAQDRPTPWSVTISEGDRRHLVLEDMIRVELDRHGPVDFMQTLAHALVQRNGPHDDLPTADLSADIQADRAETDEKIADGWRGPRRDPQPAQDRRPLDWPRATGRASHDRYARHYWSVDNDILCGQPVTSRPAPAWLTTTEVAEVTCIACRMTLRARDIATPVTDFVRAAMEDPPITFDPEALREPAHTPAPGICQHPLCVKARTPIATLPSDLQPAIPYPEWMLRDAAPTVVEADAVLLTDHGVKVVLGQPGEHERPMTPVEDEIRAVLNRYSAEAPSGTPDHILAVYLVDCLKAYNEAVSQRAVWRDEPIDR